MKVSTYCIIGKDITEQDMPISFFTISV